ncbi:MAG TPA: flavin reductase [Solirubrobacteraceae bacterium]|nr:flavin reductase [Solirubrobacteraceae bacterium]
MSQFATGVTVITTRDRSGRPFGTTANAVSSVSLRPPLVLACLRRESETLSALLDRRRFAINVLHSSQTELSDRFAQRTAPDTWDSVAHRTVAEIPVLEGAIATLRCEVHDVADGGDHTVVVGRVIGLDRVSAENDPLLFYAGSYRRIGDPPPAPLPSVLTEVALPSREGPLRMLSLSDDEQHTSVAVLTGDPRGRRSVLVYPHASCLLGDALGSTACSSRMRLHDMQARMRSEGVGVTVYHRDAGLGFGTCGCTDGSGTPPRLSDEALAALARAVRALDLRAVRLVCASADEPRAARAGVPIGEVIRLGGD